MESALLAEGSLPEDPTREVRDQNYEAELRRVYHARKADCVEDVLMIRIQVVNSSQKFGPSELQTRSWKSLPEPRLLSLPVQRLLLLQIGLALKVVVGLWHSDLFVE